MPFTGSFARRVGRQTARQLCKVQQLRRLSIHEADSLALLKSAGVRVPLFKVASNEEEASVAAKEIVSHSGKSLVVVKAQVLAGGRSKGRFSSGLEGGVKLVSSLAEAAAVSAQMLGHRLFTLQTGSRGRPCHRVMLAEHTVGRREAYLALALDRNRAGLIVMASPHGGVNIEEVSQHSPSTIVTEAVDIEQGLHHDQVLRIAHALELSSGSATKQAADIVTKLYGLFLRHDASLIEVNPLMEDVHGKVSCMDCKINFDDSAHYRQQNIFALKDRSQEDPRDLLAQDADLNYIALDGNIGCLVNGAGLAMATMDIIKLKGGSPANFLDVGGSATVEQVTAAFKIITSDASVRAVLVNIFGGIMRCDIIARGIIEAVNQLGLKIPLVVRLQGTRVDDAKALMVESGLRIMSVGCLNEAADMAVRLADGTCNNGSDLLTQFRLPL